MNNSLKYCMKNKTGLQPVSRPVERVHYLGGWSGGLFWLGKNLHFAKAQNECSKKCIFGGKKSRISTRSFNKKFGVKKSRVLTRTFKSNVQNEH